MHSCNTSSARTRHEQTWIHKTHHDPDLGKPPPSLLQYTLWLPTRHFVSELPSGSLKIAKVETSTTLGPHNFVCKPPIQMRFNAKLQPSSRTFQQYVTHHLHVRRLGRFPTFQWSSQIDKLTPDPSFGHNLCFRCLIRSCEPILEMYVLRAFQLYNKLFKPLSFDPCNRLLKIQMSIGTPTPKVQTPFGV